MSGISSARHALRISLAVTLTLTVPSGEGALLAQTPLPRITSQDSTLDNLVTPSGARTTLLGSLGAELRAGNGPGRMLLIPGFGFGAEVFRPLMDAFASTHTMWAVSLPGFGGTQPPPAPSAGTSFGAQTWTNGALEAIGALLVREDLRNVVLVGHWLGGTQLAIRAARRHPGRISAVVLLAGSARTAIPGRPDATLEQRVAYMDRVMAPRWFRTVTRETWDDNNFLPHDYAVHPVLGLRLWRQAASPSLHTWVRYLCEYNAQDVTPELAAVEAPTLLVHPGLEGLWAEAGREYMTMFTKGSWGTLTSTRVKEVTIPNTRAVPWADRRDEVVTAITEFLNASGRR